MSILIIDMVPGFHFQLLHGRSGGKRVIEKWMRKEYQHVDSVESR